MDEFMKKLAEAIKAKANKDGVYTIKDFFCELSDGEEYVADIHLTVSKHGYIMYQEGHWSTTPLDRLAFYEVKRIAHILGL